MTRFSAHSGDGPFFKEMFKALKEIFQRLYQFLVAKRADESGPPKNGKGDLAFQISLFSVSMKSKQQGVAEMQRHHKLTGLLVPMMVLIFALAGCVPSVQRIAEEFGMQ
jgi:hypothetical protein